MCWPSASIKQKRTHIEKGYQSIKAICAHSNLDIYLYLHTQLTQHLAAYHIYFPNNKKFYSHNVRETMQIINNKQDVISVCFNILK